MSQISIEYANKINEIAEQIYEPRHERFFSVMRKLIKEMKNYKIKSTSGGKRDEIVDRMVSSIYHSSNIRLGDIMDLMQQIGDIHPIAIQMYLLISYHLIVTRISPEIVEISNGVNPEDYRDKRNWKTYNWMNKVIKDFVLSIVCFNRHEFSNIINELEKEGFRRL